jgi:hypothetical protein
VIIYINTPQKGGHVWKSLMKIWYRNSAPVIKLKKNSAAHTGLVLRSYDIIYTKKEEEGTGLSRTLLPEKRKLPTLSSVLHCHNVLTLLNPASMQQLSRDVFRFPILQN